IGVPEALEKRMTKQFGRPLLEVALSLGAETTAGSTVVLPAPGGQRVVAVGLGDIDVTPEQVRRAAGNGVRKAAGLAGDNAVIVAVCLDAVEPEVIRGAAEGALLGAYSFVKLSAAPVASKFASITVVSNSGKPEARRAVESARIVATAVCLARDWVNTPANALYPEVFAD